MRTYVGYIFIKLVESGFGEASTLSVQPCVAATFTKDGILACFTLVHSIIFFRHTGQTKVPFSFFFLLLFEGEPFDDLCRLALVVDSLLVSIADITEGQFQIMPFTKGRFAKVSRKSVLIRQNKANLY